MHTFFTFFEVLIFVGMSAICSGLNLSLMSLDVSDLERRARYALALAERAFDGFDERVIGAERFVNRQAG